MTITGVEAEWFLELIKREETDAKTKDRAYTFPAKTGQDRQETINALMERLQNHYSNI